MSISKGVTGYLYLINKASQNNKRLIDFLHSNLSRLIPGGIKFLYTVVSESDEKSLRIRGITKFPTLVIEQGVPTLVGVSAIEKYLISKFLGGNYKGNVGGAGNAGKRVSFPSTIAPSSSSHPQTAEDEIEAFQRNMLGPITKNAQGHLQVQDQEDSEEDNFAKTLQQRLQHELNNRKNLNPSFGKGLPDDATKQKNNTGLRPDNIVQTVPPISSAGSAKAAIDRMGLSRSKDMDNDMLARFLDNQEVTPM